MDDQDESVLALRVEERNTVEESCPGACVSTNSATKWNRDKVVISLIFSKPR